MQKNRELSGFCKNRRSRIFVLNSEMLKEFLKIERLLPTRFSNFCRYRPKAISF